MHLVGAGVALSCVTVPMVLFHVLVVTDTSSYVMALVYAIMVTAANVISTSILQLASCFISHPTQGGYSTTYACLA